MRGFREFRRNCRGFRGCSPARRLAAVAPCAWPVEGMDAELVHLLHLIDPGRTHPIGVVMRRLGDFRQPELAVENRLADFLGAVPHVGFARDIGVVIAGEAESARKMPWMVLESHPGA